jgi:hypothetical protein
MEEFKTAADTIEIKSRLFKAEDYPTIKSWWEDWGFPAVDPVMLPHVGVVSELNGVPVAMAFLYQTGTPMAWAEWITADKKADKQVRAKALDHCIDTICFSAKLLGCAVVFSSIKNPSLEKRMTEHGFVVADANTTNMIRRL